ncbi:MAG TPA: cation:proton antiporter [Thermoleophilaceae bacterium]|nr:cation:proton antiporter [Thermoleophilaceae bacterium]
MVAGFLLGEAGLEVLEFDPTGQFVQGLAVVALILILFRDGLEVEEEMLQRAWRLPFRKLVLAMPLTAVLVALAAHLVTDLDWTESFLLGRAALAHRSRALLHSRDQPARAEGDSALAQSRVGAERRARLARRARLHAAAAAADDFVWWEFVLQDVAVGFVAGLVVAFVASRLMPRKTQLGRDVSSHQKSLYALGVAFAAYGVAVLPPEGNGFISVFVAAIAFGIWRPDVRECFESRAEDVIEVVKLGVFLVFGAILTLDGLFQDGWAAVAIVAFTLLVARPVAVFAALTESSEVDLRAKAFMAWFGPK